MIRPPMPDDIDDIAAIYAPIVRDTIISFETESPSKDDLLDRIHKSHEWLVYERDNGVVAYAYAAPFHPRPAYRWSVEVSILWPPRLGESASDGSCSRSCFAVSPIVAS